MARLGAASPEQPLAPELVVAFRKALEDWMKDHKMFAATLEELAGQLAVLEPDSSGAAPGTARGPPSELLQRVLAQAPSERLQAYLDGTLQAARRLQRGLPEQLDQNLRLLSILAAEMRGLMRQMEHLVDAAAAALEGGGKGGGDPAGSCVGSEGAGSGEDGGNEVGGDQVLLMAAVLDGVAKETHMVERAAEGITLTTPAEEVTAVATVTGLQPFMNDTLLAALGEAGGTE